LDKSPDLQNNTEQEKQPPKIEIAAVSTRVFFKLAQRPEAMVMAISMRDIMDQHEKDKVRSDDLLEFIPKEYRDFADIFSTAEADTLAPYRGSANYHIILKAGMKPDWAPKLLCVQLYNNPFPLSKVVPLSQTDPATDPCRRLSNHTPYSV
jgi:hypothetical protein